MQKSQLRLAIMMVSAVLLLGACNMFKSTDDKTITTDIQAKLFSDPVLKTRYIHVESNHGIVTVSGSVGTDLEKAAVERIASQEDGVKNVVDLLSVAPPVAAAAPPPASTETAESAPPPQSVAAPPTTPREHSARAKPRRQHHAQATSQQDNASAQLQAYTDSVSPQDAGNPAPAPAPANPAPPAPATAAPAQAAAPPPPPAPAPAPKPVEHLTIPAGTVVTIRMIDSIDSSRNHSGDEFAAGLDSPIVVDDRVVAPRGGDARVRLVDVQSAGRMTGQSQLQLELVSLSINGVPYPTQSGYYEQHGGSRGRRTAETVGGGAVLGALIGGILGHGKGAAIGSIAGAGAGTAVQVSTKGEQVKVPAETKLDFTLQSPVTVAVTGG